MNFMFEWQEQYEILFLPREHKIHIFEPTCNVLFIVWRLNVEYFRFYCFNVVKFYRDTVGPYCSKQKIQKYSGAKYIERLNPIKQNSVS